MTRSKPPFALGLVLGPAVGWLLGFGANAPAPDDPAAKRTHLVGRTPEGWKVYRIDTSVDPRFVAVRDDKLVNLR